MPDFENLAYLYLRYWKKYDALAARFNENFKVFEKETSEEVRKAGPKRLKI